MLTGDSPGFNDATDYGRTINMAYVSDQFLKPTASGTFVWHIVAVILIVLGGIFAKTSHNSYKSILEQEFRMLESQAQIGDATISGALRGLNLVLQSAIDDIQAIPTLPPQHFKQRQLSLLTQFPEIETLFAVDSTGRINTAESIHHPDSTNLIRSFDASQREYFSFHRNAKPQDYYRTEISRPFNTVDNHHTITISRAIRNKNGEFKGVAVIALSPTYFDQVLKQVLSNDLLDAAAIHNRFGDIIYRFPNPEKHIGTNISESDAFKSYLNSEQHFTRYVGITKTDSTKRILVFSKIGNTDLDIGVSGQFYAVMTEWFSNVQMKLLSFVIIAFLCITLAVEIKQRLLAKHARDAAEQRFRAYFERSMVGMVTMSQEQSWIDFNPALCDILGYSANELSEKKWVQLSHPEDVPQERAQFDQLVAGHINEFVLDKRMIHSTGQIIFTYLAVRAVRKFDSSIDYIVVLINDITERKKAEQELERLAQTDALTGLYNRRHFMLLAEKEHARSVRYGGELSVLMMDIDHFKTVNDTYGHQTGDLVLQEFANICRASFRNIDAIGRLGGEEFAVVLPQTACQQAFEVGERLRQSVEACALLLPPNGQSLRFTVSIGVATLGQTSVNLETLLGLSDNALYESKHRGRNRVSVFGKT